MTLIYFITILLTILYVLSAIIIAKKYIRHKHANTKKTWEYNLEQAKEILDKTLIEINCKPTWTQEKQIKKASFDYQGGHFLIIIDKNTPFAKIFYMAFHETEITQIEITRRLCNQANILADNAIVIYSIEPEENKVQTSIVSKINIQENSCKDILQRVLNEIFICRNYYIEHFNKITLTNKDKDEEKIFALKQRENTLLKEQEIYLQQNADNLRTDNNQKHITINKILKNILTLNNFKPEKLTIWSNNKKDILNENDIYNFNLENILIKDNNIINKRAVAILKLKNNNSEELNKEIYFIAKTELQTKEAIYYRIIINITPVNIIRNINNANINNKCKTISLACAHDILPPQQRMAQFKYIWKETLEKIKKGETKNLTPGQQIIANSQQQNIAEEVYQAIKYFQAACYINALTHFINAYRQLNDNFENITQEQRANFFEICYYIGFCYIELKQYKLAAFYLDIIQPLQQINSTKAYINALTANNDFRALPIIMGYYNNLKSIQQENDKEKGLNNAEKNFLNFLEKKRADIYMQRGKYNEAEKIFLSMMNPEDMDTLNYAIKQLEKIRKLKGETI